MKAQIEKKDLLLLQANIIDAVRIMHVTMGRFQELPGVVEGMLQRELNEERNAPRLAVGDV